MKEGQAFHGFVCLCDFSVFFHWKQSSNLNLIHTAALVGQKSEVNVNCIQALNHLLLRPCVVGVMAKGHTRLWQGHLREMGKRQRKVRKFKPVSSPRQISVKRSKVWPWPLGLRAHYRPRVEIVGSHISLKQKKLNERDMVLNIRYFSTRCVFGNG